MSREPICPHGYPWPQGSAAPTDCPACDSARPGGSPAPAVAAVRSALPEATVRLRAPADVTATRVTAATPVPAAARPGPPQWPEVPGYEILGELGRGGMGVVYKARQKGLNRTVALKMIAAGQAVSADLLARFRSEAEAIARLQQPNIIQVYEIGVAPSGPYFAMEYAEGGSLAERWAGNPQPPRAAAQTVAVLATAVQAAHDQGIIHRDIKPANILLAYLSGSQSSNRGGKRPAENAGQRSDADLVPKISDFGLARRVDDGRGLTLSGQVMGTPGYMAPEQARGGLNDVSPAADVYALGVLLYEALTGTPPHRGVSGLEAVHLMLSHEPPPASRLRPKVPRDLDTICLRCLQREPHRRYPSAGALAEDLERYLAGKPIKARRTPAWERVWKWSRRHPSIAALSAALAFTSSLGLALVLSQWQRAEAERVLTDGARRQAVELAAAEARARHEAQVLSANLLLERGVGLCEAGDYGPGLQWLARALEVAPADGTGLVRSARRLLGGWGRQLRLPRAVFPRGQEIEAAALSPDGKTVAAGVGNLVYLLPSDGRGARAAPLVLGGPVTAVAFGAGGDVLLTAGADGTARLWDAATGRPRGEPFRHAGKLRSAAFAPAGAFALTAGNDGTARLWDAATGRPRGDPLRHGAAVVAVAASRDGTLVATAGADGCVRLWEVAAGRARGGPLLHDSAPTALAFSPDGKALATAGSDNLARVWETATGRLLQQLSGHSALVRVLAFSPDGSTLVTGSDDRTAVLWSLATGAPRARLAHHESVRLVAFSPGGKAVATGSADYTARMWSSDSGRPLGGPLPHQGEIGALSFGPDGQTLLTAGDDGIVRLWPTEPPGVAAGTLSTGTRVQRLAVAADGRTVLAHGPGVTRRWDLETGERRDVAPGVTAPVVAFSRDGTRLLCLEPGLSVRALDTITGQPVGPPLRHEVAPVAAAISPDGKLAATGCDDGDCGVRVWDVASGTLLHTMYAHGRKVAALAFSTDGRRLASASWDRTARLWDVETGAAVGEPMRHHDLVGAVAFSADGAAMLTGSDDYTARLWSTETSRPLGPPLRHGEKVESVDVSPDGTVLLTTGNDGTARLWEASSGKPLGPPLPYRGGLSVATFARDGRTFLTGGREGVIRRWTVPEPLEGDDVAVRLWLQVHTGLRMDASGACEPLEPSAWYQAFVRWRHLQ